MTNLKFKNKYYRKLIVKMKYNNYNLIKKNNLLNRNPILQIVLYVNGYLFLNS